MAPGMQEISEQKLSRFLFTPIVRWAANRQVEVADEETVRATVRPIALLAGVLVFKGLLALLLLVGDVLVVVTGAVTVVVTVAAAWVGFAVIDLLAGALITRARAAELAFDNMLIRLLRRTAKLLFSPSHSSMPPPRSTSTLYLSWAVWAWPAWLSLSRPRT